MPLIKLYIYGKHEDYLNSLKFLPDNENIIYIKSIKEFLEQSKNHDSLQISGILRAGMAVSEGFLEYYSATKVKDDEIVLTHTKKALDAPLSGVFEKYIDDSINIYDFIMSYSHLLRELLDDGWNNFENYIQELKLEKYIDNQMFVYKINPKIVSIHEERCSIFKDIENISKDIIDMQKDGVSIEVKNSILAREMSERRIEQSNINPVENRVVEESPFTGDIQDRSAMMKHFNYEAREKNMTIWNIS